MRLRILALLLSCAAALPAQSRTIERVLAIVNDQVLLLSDVEAFRKRLTADGLVDEALVQMAGKDRLIKDRQALTNFLIDEKVLDSEVKKRGMEVTFERVEQEIRNILKARQINRNQLKDVLAAKGATLADYQAFIKSSIERQSLIEREVSSRIKISDEDIAAHYMREKGPRQNQSYEYSLAHILFLPANGGEKAAKERAEQVLAKIKKGQPFEKMAEQSSEDPNFSKDGFLGDFKSGEMTKELEDGVRGLDVGAVSPAIKTRRGIHIVKVLKKKVIGDPELEEKKEQIRAQLFSEVFKRQFRSWLDQRRDEAFIRINAGPDANKT
jgi:peptidyl-prolyl cis-trans isomerase SurA